MGKITMKQTLDITFWAITEELADELFDYVCDKWFENNSDEELEFVRYKKLNEGFEVTWKYTCTRTCSYFPATYWEPEEIDYDVFISDDEPVDWIEAFKKERNLDNEQLDDISTDENFEQSYD